LPLTRRVVPLGLSSWLRHACSPSADTSPSRCISYAVTKIARSFCISSAEGAPEAAKIPVARALQVSRAHSTSNRGKGDELGSDRRHRSSRAGSPARKRLATSPRIGPPRTHG
jgi:hypothetical protein